jgi:hypothetical protein
MNSYDVHNWRKERYYNEQTDNFFKAHIPILDAVYRSWSNKEPGKKEYDKNIYIIFLVYGSL